MFASNLSLEKDVVQKYELEKMLSQVKDCRSISKKV